MIPLLTVDVMYLQYTAPQQPQPQLTPLETIAKEIEMFEHKVRSLKAARPPYAYDHEV